MSSERNDYLHGPTATFSPIPEAQWWPKYWALAIVVVNALDRELEELVGPDQVETVEVHLEQNQKNLENRLKMLLERAKQRLSQFETGTLPAKVARNWKSGSPVDAGLSHTADAACPACDHLGLLEGDDVEDVEIEYQQIAEDDYEAVIDVTVTSEYFGCNNCGLILDTVELISLAGLDPSFPDEGGEEDITEYEYEYGND